MELQGFNMRFRLKFVNFLFLLLFSQCSFASARVAENPIYIEGQGVFPLAKAVDMCGLAYFQVKALKRDGVLLLGECGAFSATFLSVLDLHQLPFWINGSVTTMQQAVADKIVSYLDCLSILNKTVEGFYLDFAAYENIKSEDFLKLVQLEVYLRMVNKIRHVTAAFGPPLISDSNFYGQYDYYRSRANIFFNPTSLDNQSVIFANMFLDHRYVGFGSGQVHSDAAFETWFKVKSNILKMGYSQGFRFGGSQGAQPWIGAQVYLQGWKDKFGGAAAVGSILPNRMLIAGELFYRKQRRRNFKYLNPYSGGIAVLKDTHKVQLIDDKKHRYRIKFGIGKLSLVSPESGFWFSYEKEKKTIYRTYANLKEAQRFYLSSKKWGVQHIFKKAYGKNLPDLASPMTWNIGEGVEKTISGSFFGGGIAGLRGAFILSMIHAGMTFAFRGDFKIRVHKISKNLIEVEFEIRKIREWGPFLSLLGLEKIHKSKSLGLSSKIVYEFDLENEAAWERYQLLLQGFPPGIEAPHFSNNRQSQKVKLMKRFHDVSSELNGLGIKLKGLEYSYFPGRNFWQGIKIEWLPQNNKWSGLGTGRSKAQGYTLRTDGKKVYSNEIILKRQSREKLHHGQFSVLVSAEFKKKYSKNDLFVNTKHNTSAELHIRAVFSDTYVRKNSQNKLAGIINRNFSTRIENFDVKGHRQTQDVVVNRKLSLKDINNMKNLSMRDLGHILEKIAIKRSAVQGLLRKLNSHPEKQGPRLILAFIVEYGLKGFALVHHMSGGKAHDLEILSESNSYDDPVTQAKHLLLKYSRVGQKKKSTDSVRIVNINRKTSTKHLNKMYKEMYEVIKNLYQGILDLRHDKFLSYQMTQQKHYPIGLYSYYSHLLSLEMAKTHLFALLDLEMQGFSLSERIDVINKLSKRKYKEFAWKIEQRQFSQLEVDIN